MQRNQEPPGPSSEQQRGIALITVLTILSLAAIMILAFLTLTETELTASTAYARGIEAEHLAGTGVNLVMHQLRAATEGQTKGGELAVWASQPGMVRTWRQDGDFYKAFKLYSDDAMVEQDQDALGEDAAELENWDDENRGGIYVDLNEPVIRGDLLFYPIVDPRAKTDVRGQRILGFDYDVSQVGEGPSGKSLPMPVKWLYQLEDGTLGTLSDDFRFTPLNPEGGSGKPSSRNPIVGRIAFWADDETSKININTASEPTPWDTPRSSGTQDRMMAKFQPGAQEYQRFPGHPATTALSPVLFPERDMHWTEKEILYGVVPRVSGGGSKGGSVGVAYLKFHTHAQQVEIDSDRLYANVDEFLFAPDRTPNLFPAWGGVRRNLYGGFAARGQEGDLASYLSRSRFFLTAHSRAPEINAFNLPRVSIWPSSLEREREGTGEPMRSVFDEAIRFCATLGPIPDGYDPSRLRSGEDDERLLFHFQRADSDSPVDDWNDIERNRQVYAYLDWLMGERTPGYRKSFHQKYGDDSQQLLTEIFDYIRSTNLYDDNLDRLYYDHKEWREGEVAQFTDGRARLKDNKGNLHDAAVQVWPGHGQVAPIYIEDNETMGFGRFYTVSEAGFQFICNADAGDEEQEDAEGKPTGGYLGSNNPETNDALPNRLAKGEKSLQAIFLMDLFAPSVGWTQLRDDLTIGVEFVGNFSLGGKSLQMGVEGDEVQTTGARLGDRASAANWGGNYGFWTLTGGRLAPERKPMKEDRGYKGSNGNRQNAYPFISVPVVVDGTGKTISFSGGDLVISIYSGHVGDQDPEEKPELVQRIAMNFPSTTIPMPQLVNWRYNGGGVSKHKWDPRNENSYEKNDDGTYKTDPKSEKRILKEVVYDKTSVIDPSYWWAFHRDGVGGAAFYPEAVNKKNMRSVNWHKVKNPDGSDSRVQKYDSNGYPLHNIAEPYRGRLSHMDSPSWTFVPGAQISRYRNSKDVQGKKIRPGYDVVRTLAPIHGDYRLVAAKREVPKEDFQPHRFYHDGDRYLAHGFTGQTSNVAGVHGYDFGRGIVDTADYPGSKFPDVPADEKDYDHRKRGEDPDHPNQFGDFDNGFALVIDGAYINKPDEGNTRVNGRRWADQNPVGGNQSANPYHRQPGGGGTADMKGATATPYFNGEDQQEPATEAFFSPNRQIPSPGMFGSLPTGVKRGQPWQTLLLRPQEGHPGEESPPDHRILDLFWMPVVEPYAISEPFSTAGKINLNYQMQPFTHITRSTAVRAALKGEQLLVIPAARGQDYKREAGAGAMNDVRFPIDVDETLIQFEERFEENQIFRSESEICELHLVPKRMKRAFDAMTNKFSLEAMRKDFWEKNALTGDNSRERPYTNLYPRLTTKSNTYRIHYRAESIRQSPFSPNDPGKRRGDEEFEIFDPSMDRSMSHYRGSTLVERRIDPAHPSIPDYAVEQNHNRPLSEFYSFRIISQRRFAP